MLVWQYVSPPYTTSHIYGRRTHLVPSIYHAVLFQEPYSRYAYPVSNVLFLNLFLAYMHAYTTVRTLRTPIRYVSQCLGSTRDKMVGANGTCISVASHRTHMEAVGLGDREARHRSIIMSGRERSHPYTPPHVLLDAKPAIAWSPEPTCYGQPAIFPASFFIA
jgi:hypothetical protein